MARPRKPERPPVEPAEPVPLFRSWRAAYVSVIVWTLLTFLGLYGFERWAS